MSGRAARVHSVTFALIQNFAQKVGLARLTRQQARQQARQLARRAYDAIDMAYTCIRCNRYYGTQRRAEYPTHMP